MEVAMSFLKGCLVVVFVGLMLGGCAFQESITFCKYADDCYRETKKQDRELRDMLMVEHSRIWKAIHKLQKQ